MILNCDICDKLRIPCDGGGACHPPQGGVGRRGGEPHLQGARLGHPGMGRHGVSVYEWGGPLIYLDGYTEQKNIL